jgi:hypothetical protein
MAKYMPPGTAITCIEANSENAAVARAVLKKGLGYDVFVDWSTSASSDSGDGDSKGSKGSKSRKGPSVRIVEGISTKVLRSTALEDHDLALGLGPFDFVFLDHDKDCYLKDLRLLEEKRLITQNCEVVADNVVFPGAPGYLEYVGGIPSKSSSAGGVGGDGKPTGSSVVKGNGGSGSGSGSGGLYSTRLVSVPFERVGFETKWTQVDDAMSISKRIPYDIP